MPFVVNAEAILHQSSFREANFRISVSSSVLACLLSISSMPSLWASRLVAEWCSRHGCHRQKYRLAASLPSASSPRSAFGTICSISRTTPTELERAAAQCCSGTETPTAGAWFMALLSPPPLQRPLRHSGAAVPRRTRRGYCSAIAVDAPSPLAGGVSGVRWGSSTLQGRRSEMEDDAVVCSEDLTGFTFAAVFDGHAGMSSVEFLRLEQNEDESGATATVMFVGTDALIISHVGDSSVVLSRNGKAEVLTSPHRPFGNNKVSLEEVKRIRAAGGWFKEDLVTSTPDIYHTHLGSDTEFILLASDGLWDYMKRSACSISQSKIL
ncbi:Protein phosphatase 2C 57 [Apostasia shenzhenica]|uniref:protein-serine/threonine phosphatase n=1 Tax=Apostasia shenzhenica TaxID=1088818 RepID=A0A2I0AU63_9ASPA|nr:Protein phosphatase 2C 57 [Apostasia shenzhenica]